MKRPNKNFWKDKKVFLTGHTGFKGAWAALWLHQLGARVYGYSEGIVSEPSIFGVANVQPTLASHVIGDIRDQSKMAEAIQQANPDVAIHMAAQPLVIPSYNDPIATFDVNVMGTAKFLEVCRNQKDLQAALVITTDKCYENKEQEEGYSETDAMGGYDPYSASKGCAELVVSAYQRSFFEKTSTALASARAGNVIGGGDWAEYRLIPDYVRSVASKKNFTIRSPKSVRPWQHVLDPVCGYLVLIEHLCSDQRKYSGGWNFGPNHEDAAPVEVVLDKLLKFWPAGIEVIKEQAVFHEAKLLRLKTEKAKSQLGWGPGWNLESAVKNTAHWYQAYFSGTDMRQFTLSQIDAFEQGRS